MVMSKGLSPNAVKTALDNVLMPAFNYKQAAGYVGADSNVVFKQDVATNSAVIEEVQKGVGLFTTRTELQDVAQDNSFIGNQKIHSVLNYDKSIDISKTYMEDDMHSTYENMVQDMGRKARITMDDNAFGVLRGGFATYTTGDGAYIFSAAHSTLNGDTVDNLSTAAFSESSLDAAIVDLREQKDQAGVVMDNVPSVLVVPPKLFKTACEVLKSEMRSGTGNNDMNVYLTQYGIQLATNSRLGAAAGGSDTAWFLLADNHRLTRWIRKGLETTLVDWKGQRNNAYIYKAGFREVVGATDYIGLWGSTGAV